MFQTFCWLLKSILWWSLAPQTLLKYMNFDWIMWDILFPRFEKTKWGSVVLVSQLLWLWSPERIVKFWGRGCCAGDPSQYVPGQQTYRHELCCICIPAQLLSICSTSCCIPFPRLHFSGMAAFTTDKPIIRRSCHLPPRRPFTVNLWEHSELSEHQQQHQFNFIVSDMRVPNWPRTKQCSSAFHFELDFCWMPFSIRSCCLPWKSRRQEEDYSWSRHEDVSFQYHLILVHSRLKVNRPASG